MDDTTVLLIAGAAIVMLGFSKTLQSVDNTASSVVNNLPWYAAGAGIVWGAVETAPYWMPAVLL